MATKKITLETLATQLAKMDARVVKMDTHMVKNGHPNGKDG